jgi:hypothetical protein
MMLHSSSSSIAQTMSGWRRSRLIRAKMSMRSGCPKQTSTTM